ncbi:hypothetical protein Tco_0483899 [Tanacetum coccineum]
MRRACAFVPMETEIRREVPELAARSSKRDAEEELDQGSSKSSSRRADMLKLCQNQNIKAMTKVVSLKIQRMYGKIMFNLEILQRYKKIELWVDVEESV